MEPYTIIDVHSLFLNTYFLQPKDSGINESNQNALVTEHATPGKYLSLDFDCTLNRLAIIPTGAKSQAVSDGNIKEKNSDDIPG